MKGRWLPTLPELSREALIVLGGALVAAFVVGNVPGVRDWIVKQWGNAQH